MLHAAAMLIVLSLLGAGMTASHMPVDKLWMAFAGASASTLVALRFGGAGSAFLRVPLLLLAAPRWCAATLSALARILRAALAADVTISPALVRVTATPSPRLVGALSAHPGMVAVEADEAGLLTHVLNEHDAALGGGQ